MSYKDEFIGLVAPFIVKECKQRGYAYPSAIIAQAICESNWGKSSLSAKWYNYFGMKCGSKWKGKSVNLKTKEEYTVGTLTTIKDNFRAYDNVAEGIAGYFDFISSARYTNLKQATSAEDYCRLLKQDGYATSSTYVNTLVSIIKSNNLKVYDLQEEVNDVLIMQNVKLLCNMNYRRKPSTSAEVIRVLPKGTTITVRAERKVGNSMWYYDGTAWICAWDSKKKYVQGV